MKKSEAKGSYCHPRWDIRRPFLGTNPLPLLLAPYVSISHSCVRAHWLADLDSGVGLGRRPCFGAARPAGGPRESTASERTRWAIRAHGGWLSGSGHPPGCAQLWGVPPPSGASRPMAESRAHSQTPGIWGAQALGQHQSLTREELTPWLEDVEAFARGAPYGEGRCGAVNFGGGIWWGWGFF